MPQRFAYLLAPLLAGLFLHSSPSFSAEPIRYTLRFPAPQTHYVEVEATVPTDGKPEVELMMAVWTPGSYLVREYARNVEGLSAKTPEGKSLTIEKTRKNRWKIGTPDAERISVFYSVYGREMTVQSNWIDESFTMLNGAATFLTLAGSTVRPHEVSLVLPPNWKRSVTGLPDIPGPPGHRYVAADFDTLVDSPIYAGNPTIYEFEVDGKKHFLVNEGEGGIWDGPKSAKDVEAIVRTERDLWGHLPYDKYVFFNMLVEGSGGLEHKNSTLLMASRWATRRRADYLSWLNLVAHEFFHTWNVKRMRPVELGPFDYEGEVLTRSLWIAEGITSYYDRLTVRRAGLSTVEEYLTGDQPPPGSDSDQPKGDIEKLQETPGRLVQPLETASFDAWIKYYRRDENTPNTAISYYTKGAVVGLLLDAKIRQATDGAKSLDDVMRLVYSRYSGEKGYTPQEFRAAAQEVAGVDLKEWFRLALETTEELDYSQASGWYGLRFGKGSKGKVNDKAPEKAWLGLVTKPEGGKLMVTGVKRETPGHALGFNVGDEIVGIDEERILPEQWSRRMEQFRPQDRVSILIARRGRLMRIATTFGKEPVTAWKWEIDPDAGDPAKAHRKAWLKD